MTHEADAYCQRPCGHRGQHEDSRGQSVFRSEAMSGGMKSPERQALAEFMALVAQWERRIQKGCDCFRCVTFREVMADLAQVITKSSHAQAAGAVAASTSAAGGVVLPSVPNGADSGAPLSSHQEHKS